MEQAAADAIARAREIAARLSECAYIPYLIFCLLCYDSNQKWYCIGGLGGGMGSELGKRKAEDGFSGAGCMYLYLYFHVLSLWLFT